MQIKHFVFVSCVFVLAASCSHSTELQPRVIYPGEAVGGWFWIAAPNILAVKIRKATWLDREIEIAPHRLRLVQVNADVENVIAGDFTSNSVQFYFFANLPRTEGRGGFNATKYWLEPGHHYVVFLRQEQGVLRTMADMGELEVQVHSGLHRQSDLPPISSGEEIAQRVAYVVLTPGENSDEESFANHLGSDWGRVESLISTKYSVILLQNLRADARKSIRKQACLLVAEHYPPLDNCLTDLVDDTDAVVSREAKYILQVHDGLIPTIIEVLKTDPTHLRGTGKARDLADDMELYTAHRNPEIRRLACNALHQFFPGRTFPNCSTKTAGARSIGGQAPEKRRKQGQTNISRNF